MVKAPERTPAGLRGTRSEARPGAQPDAETRALPLRLSVARGSLGVELTQPIRRESFVVEELSLGLLGLAFPVDLSKGVKQFRSRRARLERLAVRLDFEALRPLLEQLASEFFDERVEVRVRVRGRPSEVQEAAEPSLTVTLHGEALTLVFDLVLAAGAGPRFVVDAARGRGLRDLPLALALRLLDRLTERWSASGHDVRRDGRALEIAGLARALCLDILPDFGFRVPSVEAPLVERVEAVRGELRLVLDERGGDVSIGRRGIQLGGLAEFTRSADEAMARGDYDEARRACLEALERAPGNREALVLLASIDGRAGGRAESALAFLEELGSFARGTIPSREYALEAEILAQSGRSEAARESRRRAVELEPDAILGAGWAVELALSAEEAEERAHWLDRALERAPTFRSARRLRLELRLGRGDLRGALADAEHLEAACRTPTDRAELTDAVGRALLAAGFRSEGISWLKRSLREAPEALGPRLALASAWAEAGESLRAIEMLQTIVRREVDDGNLGSLDEARFLLAELVERESLDPSLALGQLRAIESRSAYGARARVLEGRIAERIGDASVRLRAHQRLLEALELGWIDADDVGASALEVIRREEAAGQIELASRLVAALGVGDASRS